MKRFFRPWLHIVLIMTLLASLLPMNTASAASRISITNLSTSTNAAGRPTDESKVPRFTINPITVTATIEEISDAQIPEIYYEVTNMNTGTTVVEKNNKAHKTSDFEITFSNVYLTEGLNKVVIKIGETSSISSTPGWAFFTSTTNISDLKINSALYNEGAFYPDNPVQSSTLTITGNAPNANEVQAYLLGNPSPVNAYFRDGQFSFIADDINKPGSTANFKLKAGDNPLTLIALNSTKSYSQRMNVIYDNGNPFAFDANIYELNNDGTVKTSTKSKLIETPTMTTPNVRVEALVKNDLDSVGNLKYRYVDVTIGGKKFGPYDLSDAKAASRVTNLYPNKFNAGYSNTDVYVAGTDLTDDIKLHIVGNDGVELDFDSAAAGVQPLGTGATNDANVKINSTNTALIYSLQAGKLDGTKSPYKFQVKKGATVLSEYSVEVTAPALDAGDALPTVSSAGVTAGFKEGDTTDQTITFGAAVQFDKIRVDFLDLDDEQSRGTVANLSGGPAAAFTYDIPMNIAAGEYKLVISYKSLGKYHEISQRNFEVMRKDPDAPTFTSVNLTDLPDIAGKTFFALKGTNLGIYNSDIVTPVLVDSAYATQPLAVYDARKDLIIFSLADASTLNPAETYNLRFDLQRRFSDGTPFPAAGTRTTYTVPIAITSKDMTAAAGYANETVSNLYLGTDTDNLQVLENGMENVPIKVEGTGLTDENKVRLEIVTEDGLFIQDASVDNVAVSGGTTTVTGSFQDDLPVGNYYFKLYYNNVFLVQYPLAVLSPLMLSISPNVKPSDAALSAIEATGNSFGRDESKLFLQFTNPDDADFDPINVPVKAGTLSEGKKAEFDVSSLSLSEGTYDATLVYDAQALGQPLQFTVASPPADLEEDAAKSRANRYKVFKFTADLTVSTDKYQSVQFNFYNFATDNVPPTTFWFNYMNPNLPYVDYVERAIGSESVKMSESGVNEINEIPATLYAFANLKTEKVNVYIGEYSANRAPDLTVNTHNLENFGTADVKDDRRRFKIDLSNLAAGSSKLFIVPSSVVTGTKEGENYPGNKQYDIQVTSTPYVIVNNLYNGLVIENAESEINCGTGKGGCISGRIVNVPEDDLDTNPQYRIELMINETIIKFKNADFTGGDPKNGTFEIDFTSQINSVKPGKNTFRFIIFKDNLEVTRATFEVFVFSDDVPDFLSIKPIETTDVPKYVASATPNAYATTEKTVSFSGQFVNADEITLTVRSKDENGNAVVKYDRRYNNFANLDPAGSSNPRYFGTVNSPKGQFTTNNIPLATKGDTVFEFTITNDSGVVVTESITITREPLPYVIISPILVKNSKGQSQANINSNYAEIEMEAEGADTVLFGKNAAIEREVVGSDGIKRTRFFYEAANLKTGSNQIRFTVVRGEEETDGSFHVYNANTSVEGAQYKAAMNSKFKAFNGMVELEFPKNTSLMRNDRGAVNQFITSDRKILFGIANPNDGRVDKYKHPMATDGQIGNPNPIVNADARVILQEPTGRFRAASPLYWIDAGTITKDQADVADALSGSGRLPYAGTQFYARTLNDLVVPAQTGTLTLKYDGHIRDDAWRYITVYHFDIYEDYRGIVQPRWRNAGGVVNPKNNTITVPFERFGYYQVMYMDQSFDDIIAHPWARDSLDTLYAKGIMVNKESTSFIPNDPISRGEFTTMLVKVFEIPLQYSEKPTFSDVLRVNPLANGLYDYKYIETAARAGIVRGAGGGRFQPDSTITRQDAAVMIARAANLKLTGDSAKVLKSLQKEFTDANLIDIYARVAVDAVVNKGLIEGKENVLLQGQKKKTYRFDPTASFTRAEAAAVMLRVMDDQGKVPN